MKDPVQLAVFGVGQWGPNLIRNLDKPPLSHVSWVVDRDSSRLEEVTRRFPDVRTSTDVRPVFQDPNVKAVVISTPTSTHYALAKQALAAGCDVFAEKPLTNSLREAKELVDIAQRRRRILMVGHVFLYNPAVQEAKRRIQRGDLGRILYVSMERTNLGPIRSDVNAAWDLAAHDISIANDWLGQSPYSVSAIGDSWIQRGLADVVFATLRYRGHVLANLHVSWLNPRKVRQITVVGSKKMLTVDDMDLNEPLRIYDKRVRRQRRATYPDTFAAFRGVIQEGDVTIPKIGTWEPLAAECDHFIECVRSRKEPLTGPRQALDVVGTLEGIQRSMSASGQEVPV